MSFVLKDLKEHIAEEYITLERLESKCNSCRFFKGRNAEETFIYVVYEPDTMVGISRYGKKYAMLTPDSLTEEELIVFAYVLEEMGPDEEIVVFTKRDYNAVLKYLRGKKNTVTLFS